TGHTVLVIYPCTASSFATVPTMGTTLHAPHPWPHITAALRRPGPRRVAIAYLDRTAPDLLPLRAGDQLIVNAARSAVRAHATSPTALAHLLNVGVRVLSTPNLHTGLILTGDRALVGPASASHASTVAHEAALLTDHPDAIAAAHACLDALADTAVVDEVLHASATAIWQTGRVAPRAGIGSRTRTGHDFLPTPRAPDVPAAPRRLHPHRRRRNALGRNHHRPKRTGPALPHRMDPPEHPR